MFEWLFNDTGVFVRTPMAGPGALYASPMPYGPYDRLNRMLRNYRRNRVKAVVVLVTEEEIARKCRRDLLGLYEKYGMDALHFPVPDLTSPSHAMMAELVDPAARAPQGRRADCGPLQCRRGEDQCHSRLRGQAPAGNRGRRSGSPCATVPAHQHDRRAAAVRQQVGRRIGARSTCSAGRGESPTSAALTRCYSATPRSKRLSLTV